MTTTRKAGAKRSGKVQDFDVPPAAAAEISGRPKPDWETWRCIPQTALYAAVALSCDIDPKGLQVQDDGHEPDLKEFYRRLSIADANLGVRLRVVRRPEDMPEWLWVIDLADFAAWAESLGWTLPAKFPRPKAEESPKSTANDKPAEDLSTKERTSLLVIVGALAEIAELDLSRHSVAAKTIVDTLARRGVTVGVRTVEEHLKGVEAALDRKG